MNRKIFYALIFTLFPGAAFAALQIECRMIGRQDSSPYLYLRVTVRNQSSQKLGFNMNLKDGYTNASIVIKGQEISAQRDKIYNLAIPMVRSPIVEITDTAGDRAFASSSWDLKTFLNICDISSWASEKEIQDFSISYSKTSSNAVSQLEPDALPDNWLCYAPFQAVFIKDAAYNRLAPSEKDALSQWVDSGGLLIVYGSDQNKETKQLLGTIRFQSQSPLELNDLGTRISAPAWMDMAKTRGFLRDFPYLVKSGAGKYGGFILATAFLIIAGPLNYSFWKKRKRIRMILITLPLISISFCLMIIVFFIATQGFAKKGGSFSVSILDEERNAGFTISRNSLFSGLYPLGGFQFDRSTGFYPFVQTKDFSIDLTRATHLKSGIFTPSINFHYLTATPFKTRERLVYDSEERSVTNGFEQKIEGVMWNDGGEILIVRDLAPGQKKKMAPYKGKTGGRSSNLFSPEDFFTEFLLSDEEKFGKPFVSDIITAPVRDNRVKYLARFKNNPPSVQTGIRISARKNTAFLAGLE